MDIVIFGAGSRAERLLSFPLREGVRIVMVCDSNDKLHGRVLKEYKIKRLQDILTTRFDFLLVTPMQCQMDIRQQLLSWGVDEAKIVLVEDIVALQYYPSRLDDFFLITKKEFVPFQKKPAKIYTHYAGETSKAHDRRNREGFFEKYCRGEGLDIGYGSDVVVANCYGWDLQNGDAQYLEGIADEEFDFVYSSHCLEHMVDVRAALKNWFRAVKKGGYLLLAIPHRDLYEKRAMLPSRWNTDHKHMFLIGKREPPDTLDIVEEIRESLTNYDIKYIKTCDDGHTITDPLVHSDGEYQIEIVIQKTEGAR